MKRLQLYLYCALLALIPVICSAQQEATQRKPLSPKNWSKLHEGDIVFIRSRSAQSKLIADLSAPHSAPDADDVFTHCGIVFNPGDWMVHEGAGRGQVLTLKEWRVKEANGQPLHNVYVRRWQNDGDVSAKLDVLLATAKRLHETPYDEGFSWSDDFIYCSELVWKAYDAAGLAPVAVLNLKSYLDRLDPAQARAALKELNKDAVKQKYRLGKSIDPEEKAISPEDIYNSDKLISVTDDTP